MDSPLLKLPAELRNTIYQLVIENICCELKIGNHGCLQQQPALLAVNHQVRDEGMSVFVRAALAARGGIEVRVHNFDFAHIIHFITMLSPEDFRAAKSPLRLNVYLTMDDTWRAGRAELVGWLRFTGQALETITMSNTYTFEGPVAALDPEWAATVDEAISPEQRPSSYKDYQKVYMAGHGSKYIKLAWRARVARLERNRSVEEPFGFRRQEQERSLEAADGQLNVSARQGSRHRRWWRRLAKHWRLLG